MKNFTIEQLTDIITEQTELETSRCENFIRVNSMYPQLCRDRIKDKGIYLTALLELKNRLIRE